MAGREAILITIQKDIYRISIQSDSQVVVNSIIDEIPVPKVIVNLVKNIRKLLAPLSDSRIKYRHKEINCEVDRLAKLTLI